MTQHAELTIERWSEFDLAGHLLQIGVEMHRACDSLRPDRMASLRRSYERAMRLVDLTVEAHPNPNLRRELLRWRDTVAELYLQDEPRPEAHRLATKCLLWLHPQSAEQVPFLPE